MTVDRIDQKRIEEKRAEKKRSETSRETKEAFAKRYQSFLQQKAQSRDKSSLEHGQEMEKEGTQKNEQLFKKVMEVFQESKYSKNRQEQQQLNKEIKREEKSKEKEEKDSTSPSDTKTSSSRQDHARVEAYGGQGSGDGGGKEGKNQSFTGGQQQERGGKGSSHPKVEALKKIKNTLGESPESNQKFLEQLDEIIESINLGINTHGKKEMDIQLSKDYFNGLRFVAQMTEQGVVLTFYCPNKTVRNQFLAKRPLIYNRLLEKRINISRIEIK